MLALEADSTRVLQRCRRGEVLFNPDALTIKSIYLLFNLSIAPGHPKGAQWNPDLELLPERLRRNVGLLQPCEVRRTAWHD